MASQNTQSLPEEVETAKEETYSFSDIEKYANDDFKDRIKLFDSIIEINEENVGEIFKAIIEYGKNIDIINRFVEYCVEIRPKQKKSIFSLISMLFKANKYTPSKCFADENKRMLIKLNIIKKEKLTKKEKPKENEEILKAIIKDNVEAFMKIASSPEFDSKLIFYNLDLFLKIRMYPRSIAQVMALYGSVKCFKYILLDGAYNMEDVEKYAVAGGNIEIIHLLENKGHTFEDSFKTSVLFHRHSISDWILKNYEVKYIQLEEAIEAFNIRALLFLSKKFGKENITGNDLKAAVYLLDKDIIKYLVEEFHVCIHYDKSRPGFLVRSTPLSAACEKGDLDLVKYLIANEGECDEKEKESGTHYAIGAAIRASSLEILKYLIEECHYPYDNTLNLASQYNSLEIFKYLVEKCGQDPNYIDEGKRSYLHYAVSSDCLEISKYLVKECKVDIELKDDEEKTALYYALENGFTDIVKFLVEDCKAVFQSQYFCESPLEIALTNYKIDLCEYLIKNYKWNVNENSSGRNSQPLIIEAAIDGHFDLVNDMLEFCDGDINTKGKDGSTILHYACMDSKLKNVKLYIDNYNANVNAKDDDGKTPLFYAIEENKKNIVKYLIEYCHANIESCDLFGELKSYVEGRTILHEACRENDIERIRRNVENNTYYINQIFDGKTALHIAIENENIRIVKYLVDIANANIEIKDSEDRTALQIANDKGMSELIKYLVRHNASTNIKNPNDDVKALIDEKKELFEACKTGDVKKARVILKDVNCFVDQKLDGKAVLHVASENGFLELVRCFTKEFNADVEIKDDKNRTPLLVAVKANKLDIVKYLFEECHADVESMDSSNILLKEANNNNSLEMVKYLVDTCHVNLTPLNDHPKIASFIDNKYLLFEACRNEDYVTVKKFIEEDHFYPDQKYDGVTILQRSCAQGHVDMVKFLVESYNVNINLKGEDFISNMIGSDALHFACLSNDTKLIKYLVKKCNADVETKDDLGRTPLLIACANDGDDIVKYLVERCHANLDKKDKRGMKAVHFACESDNLAILNYLCDECHANPNVKDFNNRTPLHVSSESHSFLCARDLIVKYKLDVNDKDVFGQKPIDLAMANEDIDIVQFLVNKCGVVVDEKELDRLFNYSYEE